MPEQEQGSAMDLELAKKKMAREGEQEQGHSRVQDLLRVDVAMAMVMAM